MGIMPLGIRLMGQNLVGLQRVALSILTDYNEWGKNEKYRQTRCSFWNQEAILGLFWIFLPYFIAC